MVSLKLFDAKTCPEELYRFRYDIYVEELNRRQTYADHDNKIIKDPLDDFAHHVIAFKDSTIVGCVRLNLLKEGDVGLYDSFYELDKLPQATRMTASICTRYMAAKELRSTRTPLELLKRIYLFGIENGITSCFMDANAPFLDYYRKFGYHQLFEKDHPDYGRVTIMRLDSIDADYLRSVRSPFAPICEEFLARGKKADAGDQAASSPARISRLPA